MTRLWLLTFFHRPRGGAAGHEPPAAMRWPLVVLAVPSVLLRTDPDGSLHVRPLDVGPILAGGRPPAG